MQSVQILVQPVAGEGWRVHSPDVSGELVPPLCGQGSKQFRLC